jgi:hypothetical protein
LFAISPLVFTVLSLLGRKQVCDGLRYLTGVPVTEMSLLTGELTEEREAFAAVAAGSGEVDDFAASDKIWVQLLSFFDAGFLMGASCNAPAGTFIDFEKVGLMPNHAYSVLEVVQVDEHRLVRMHNPWGRYTFARALTQRPCFVLPTHPHLQRCVCTTQLSSHYPLVPYVVVCIAVSCTCVLVIL